jgi:LPS-assembly lipoprotein
MRIAITILLASALAACGFQLRSTAELPFETLFIPGATGGIGLDLKRNIQSGSRARVVDDPKLAQAVLQFTEDVREKNILSLSGTGRVREFQLRYRVGFRVHDGKGSEFLPASQIILTRDFTFNDTDVLSKELEETQIYREMQFDMVQQILRRISAATPPKPVVQ